jgi:hypothetical protein
MLEGGVGASGHGEPGPQGPPGEPGPQGEPGPPGKGLNPHLAHVCAINWAHGEYASTERIREEGLLIAFDQGVRLGDVHRHSFVLLAERQDEDDAVCWCELLAKSVQGIALLLDEETGQIRGIDPHGCEGPDDLVNGAQFLPASPLGPGTYRVVLKGDMIRDEFCRGLDADHLPPWLPERPTGNWVQGGTFESWFTVAAQVEKAQGA